VAALLAAGLQIASSGLYSRIFAGRPEGERGLLLGLHADSGQAMLAAGIEGMSAVLAAGALFYLFHATSLRAPLAPRIRIVVLLAPVLAAAGLLLVQANLIDLADRFVEDGPATESRARRLVDDSAGDRFVLTLIGNSLLAASYAFVSLHAMRAGLLHRVMGYAGVVIGALLLLPIVPGGSVTVQVLWLAALSLLLIGLWPGGRGPAWGRG
jgi:hypothetical protein